MKNKLFWIKLPYWLGIIADAIWAIALFSPALYSLLTKTPDFKPDSQVKLIMGIGGSLMTGWTFLLLWAVKNPIERRGVGLLTAFPVIFGIFSVTIIGFIEGNSTSLWILIKLPVLMILLITSYILAGNFNNNPK